MNYYEKGAGYEFSVCEGVGAIIRTSLVGGDRDLAWAAQQPDSFLAPVWTDLSNLVNNYCDARQAANTTTGNTTNSSSVNATQVALSLDLPWGQWRNDILVSFEDVLVWLARYQQYLVQVEALVGGGDSGVSVGDLAPGAPVNATGIDLSGVTQGSLVTDYNQFYSSFIQWYNLFFGVDGLVSVNERVVHDGVVPVYEWTANVTSFEGNEGADVFALERPFDVPVQFESIAEWISTKFGNVILTNACNICNGNTVTPPPTTNTSTNGTGPVTNGTSNGTTNGTGPVTNGTSNGTTTNGTDNSTVNSTVPSNSTDNSTTVVPPATNSTAPVNGTTPVDNSTVPVNGTTPVDTNSTVPVVTGPTNSTTGGSGTDTTPVTTGPTP